MLGWHSPPRDPIRKEGQTEILTQSSLKQHQHTGIAAMDETPFVFKAWEANISASLQTLLSNLVVYLKLKRRSAFYPGIRQQRSVTQDSN